MLSAFLHRQKSQSCSSSWPPKTLRSNACRPSCWPEAAQPMTTQREVHTADSLTNHFRSTCVSVDVCVCVSLSTLITVTSNQHVPLSSAALDFVFDSLLPSAVEEVYVKQLINKCKAFCCGSNFQPNSSACTAT